MMRRFVASCIFLYQKTLSGDHGLMRPLFPHGVCRFYPTCSEYTRRAVLKYGVLSGMYRGGKRILRCHPWSDGGVDHP